MQGVVGIVGFEPTASPIRTAHSTKLSYTPRHSEFPSASRKTPSLRDHGDLSYSYIHSLFFQILHTIIFGVGGEATS